MRLTVFPQVFGCFINRLAVHQCQHFFRCDLQQLPVMFGKDIGSVFTFIAMYQTSSKQAH